MRSKYHIGILSLLFLVISFISYNHFGIREVNDSPNYLGYAENLKSHFYIDSHYIWYISYVFFIYIIESLSPFELLVSVVFMQYTLSLLGLFLLYQTTWNLFKNRDIAFLSCLLSIIFIETSQWNNYILCESFYYNSIIAFLYFLSQRTFRNEEKLTIKIGVITSLLICTFSKPTGIVIPIVILIMFLGMCYRKFSKPVFVISSSIILITTLVFMNEMLSTFFLYKTYKRGEIIYSASFSPELQEYFLTRISPPTDLDLPPDDQGAIYQTVYFIAFNFWFWLKLFVVKITFYLTHIRPYWSLLHNIINFTLITILFYGSIKTLTPHKRKLKNFVLLYLGIHILVIGFTVVDYDGRFIIPILPILFILASKGLYQVTNGHFNT